MVLDGGWAGDGVVTGNSHFDESERAYLVKAVWLKPRH